MKKTPIKHHKINYDTPKKFTMMHKNQENYGNSAQLFSFCRYLLQVLPQWELQKIWLTTLEITMKHLGIWTGRSLYSCISNELLKSTAAPEDCWLNVNWGKLKKSWIPWTRMDKEGKYWLQHKSYIWHVNKLYQLEESFYNKLYMH